MNLTDYKDRNTALHWAIYSRNSNAVTNLLDAGANVFIQNIHGDTPLEMARRLQASHIAYRIEEVALENRLYMKPWWIRIFRDKVIQILKRSVLIDVFFSQKMKKCFSCALPFLGYFFLGSVFNSSLTYLTKSILLSIFIVFAMTFRINHDHHHDHDALCTSFPIYVYLASKFWLLVTLFIYIVPCE